jgi:hypothetical protein
MELRFFINGKLYDNPNNWDEVSSSIEFDPVNQITTISHDVEFVWVGDVYNLLYQTYLDGGLCDLLEVIIEGKPRNTFVRIFKGQINIAKCTFNERKRTVSVNILDDSFGARIENNKTAKVALDSTETKNGETIAASESFVFAFTSSDGSYLADSCRGYAVHDAFDFIIGWMTDNTVTFRSDFFDPIGTGDGKDDWVVSGVDLRNSGQSVSAPKFSFQEIFDLMRKVRNIGMGFQTDSDGNPVVRIEEIDFFRSNTDTILLEDINETELSFDNNILYTSIKVGSDIIEKIDCSTTCSATNDISYFGFETEYYTLTGECNSGTELDLSIDDPFIVDTNKIQEVVEFDQDSYDEKTFLIIRDSASANFLAKSDPLSNGENWYNEQYTNKYILARYQDYLAGSIGLFGLYNGYNLFEATGSTNSGILYPVQSPASTTYQPLLNVTVFDPQGRFDLVTDRFTPVDDGAYQFCLGVAIDDWPTCPSGILVSVLLNVEHYDSSGTLINTHFSDVRTHATRLSSPLYEEWTSPYISMDSGDYAIFTVDYNQDKDPSVPSNQAEIVIGGTSPDKQRFACCNSRASVPLAQVNTGQKRQLAITSFEYPIPFDDFKDLYQDTTQRIRITSEGIDRTGYINSIDYNFVKGSAQIEIISNG